MSWPTSGGGTRGYGSKWRVTRNKVMERDGWRCTLVEDGQRCTQPAHAVDHRTPKSKGGTDDPSNLRAICQRHHAQVTGRQSAEARRKLTNRRQPERHPGLLP